MHIQPTLIVNVDTTSLARLIGKRKWDKAFKELCDAAEQKAAKDVFDKIYGELPKRSYEVSERAVRGYAKNDGTAESPVMVEWMEQLSQYKQERFNFYLKMMVHLVEEEIKSSAK